MRYSSDAACRSWKQVPAAGLVRDEERPERREAPVRRQHLQPAGALLERELVPGFEARQLPRARRDDDQIERSARPVPPHHDRRVDLLDRERGRDLRRERAVPDDAEPHRAQPLRRFGRGEVERRREEGRGLAPVVRALRQQPVLRELLEGAQDRRLGARAEAGDDLRDGVPTVEERQQRRDQTFGRGALEHDRDPPVLEGESALEAREPVPGPQQGPGGEHAPYQQM